MDDNKNCIPTSPLAVIANSNLYQWCYVAWRHQCVVSRVQAQERFGDSGLTVKLEEGGLMLFGMPRVDVHLQDESDLNVSDVIRSFA